MPDEFEEQPLVSIGLLSYNRPDGLRRALEGVTGQTHRNLDICISDNASSDPRVEEVLKEFEARDSRIHCVRQPINMGFIRNFRFVYDQSRAEYFMWAADDDVLDPEFVEVCLRNLLDTGLNAVLSFTHLRKCKEDGSITDPDFVDPVHTSGSSILMRSFHYLYYSGGNQCVYGLYRKKFINEWFFARRFGNDHLALLVLLRNGNIHIDSRVFFTSTIQGAGFQRKGFHAYYAPENVVMKVCVNLSSTLTWWYEFLRCIWLTPYRPREKLLLSLFTAARFSRPRYWRRFAGDMLALFTRRDIWNFRQD